MTEAVKDTAELRRILAIPRRVETDHAALAAEMTALLRAPGGRQTLRTVQALALHDVGVYGGAFLPVGVGEGKTLISLFAGYVLEATRPMLFLPAGLIENATRARLELAADWLVPSNLRFFSYEMLGRASAAEELEDYAPDVIICDEVHRLKNRDAACTRRVERYMKAHPETPFVGMSGTIMSKSLADFAHILRWCLKDRAPVPILRHELDDWASALDEPRKGKPGDEYTRLEPGALLQFATREPTSSGTDLERARRGFRSRLTETPGVVATAGDGERVDCSIYIRAKTIRTKPITDEHFRRLRDAWCRPDGKEFEQGVEVWACARQLALGFHYEWSPPPPEDWMRARKAWSAFVRGILSRSRTLDSPLVVVQAIDAGDIDDEDGVLEAWRKVRPSFKPRTVSVWHDDTVLEECAAWARSPGIIWTEHYLFAAKLAAKTGLPYYGAKGFNSDGGYIEDADPTRAIIASIDANRDGKNLQGRDPSAREPNGWRGFNRNLIVSPPNLADAWQQTIARTHRPLQRADEVIVDVLIVCREHVNAWREALAGTAAIRDTVGGTPKLLLADRSAFPSDEELRGARGARW